MRWRNFMSSLTVAIWLVALSALAYAGPVEAQQAGNLTPPTFDQVEVDLWPEYDQPSMLVIYHLILSPSVKLPVSLTLHIPSTAGDPYNMAYRQSDGQLYNMAFTRTVEGAFSRVDFTTTSSEVQLEYYDPGIKLVNNQSTSSVLKKGNNLRAYTYEWQGEYAIKNLLIQVQQPLGASQMAITPSLGAGVTGAGGLVYYNGQVGAVPAGVKFKLSISYQKSNDSLSAPALKVQPSAPITTHTAGHSPSLVTYLPWLLGGVGLLLLVGGGIWYRRSLTEEKKAPKRKFAIPIGDSTTHLLDDRVYCHQCGKLAAEGDIFCRSCGTRLRRD